MNFYYFQKKIVENMDALKNKYFLTETIGKATVTYQKSNFAIGFCLDNYFEVSVYFAFNFPNNEIVYLGSLLEYLNFPIEDINTVNANQLNEKTFENYMHQVIPIIDKIIFRIITDEDILVRCFSSINNRDKILSQVLLLQSIKTHLNDIWRERDYIGFFNLYKENEGLLSNDRILQKKFLYVKNKTMTDQSDKTGGKDRTENQSGDGSVC